MYSPYSNSFSATQIGLRQWSFVGMIFYIDHIIFEYFFFLKLINKYFKRYISKKCYILIKNNIDPDNIEK